MISEAELAVLWPRLARAENHQARLPENGFKGGVRAGVPTRTERKARILELQAQGLSKTAIARECGISRETLQNYLVAIAKEAQ